MTPPDMSKANLDRGFTDFTDDDLRVLRGMCEAADWPIGGKALLPLLNRLDAAERALASYAEHYDPRHVVGLKDLFKAWLRSSGDGEKGDR